MWFDGHPPPHIHVEYQGFEALVEVASGNVRKGDLPRQSRPHRPRMVLGPSIRVSCWKIGRVRKHLHHWTAFKELTVIKVLHLKPLAGF